MSQWAPRGDERDPLTIDQVAKMLHCSEDHIMRMVDEGDFPVPIKTGPQGKPVWTAMTIDAWMYLRPMMRPKEPKKPPKEEK
jgi:predicted DNA-binding transcriptional regulator AlpA